MNSSVKKLDKAQVEISVEVSVEELQPYLEKAAVKISKDTKIEGFRPGKAPYDVVVAKVGEMAILQEAIDNVISKTYYNILQENKIVTIGQPKIDIEKLAPGNPFSYKATADVLPEVKVGDYSKIKIKRPKVEVTDKQVDAVVEDLRKMQQKEVLVDRASKIGDKMDINFDVFLNKVAIENGAHKKYPIVLGEGKFIPGFEEKITGLKANEEKEFEITFPDKYFDKKLSGKTAEFKVKCNGVFELELPELTDDFAKTISAEKFQSLAEVKKNIHENIIAEETQKQEQKLEVEMLDKLISASDFDTIPDILIDHEASKMLTEMQQSVSQQGLQFEDYLKSLQRTEDDLKLEFRAQAEQRIKGSILSREVYHQKKFEVRDDEISLEIENVMKSYPNNPEARQQFESENYKDYMKNIIGNRKVLEFLKSEMISD